MAWMGGGLCRVCPLTGNARFYQLQDIAGRNGKRKDILVFCQHVFQRQAVMDDDVVFAETGLGKIPPVFTTEYKYLVTIAVQLDVGFMNKCFPDHGSPYAGIIWPVKACNNRARS